MNTFGERHDIDCFPKHSPSTNTPLAEPCPICYSSGMKEREEQSWRLAPGESFGDWRVVARLGRGGMGEVYAVEDGEGQRFALKCFTAQGGDTDFLRRRFHDVGETLLQVRHPRLANVLRVGQVMVGNETCDFLLMTAIMVSPSVREAALQAPETLISAKPPSPQEPPATLTAADLPAAMLPKVLLERLWNDALAALNHLRTLGIAHGDVKPANLMLSAGGHATLVDFGLARVENPELRPAAYALTSPSLARAVRGTPEFLAPERLRGAPPTFESDLYALGATFFRLYTGLPYLGEGARLFLRELPPLWRHRLGTALDDDPKRRPAALKPPPCLTRRRLLLGFGGLATTMAFGGVWVLWRREVVCSGTSAVVLKSGVQGRLLPPPTAALPEIVLDEGATLRFPMGGEAWTLGKIQTAATSTLLLEGPGHMNVSRLGNSCMTGALRLSRGAQITCKGKLGYPVPTLIAEHDTTITVYTANNRYLSDLFSKVDLRAGGLFQTSGLRLYLNNTNTAPTLLGHGATLSCHWVSYWHSIRATEGGGIFEGAGHLWHDLFLYADLGATLTVRGRLFMYDYWRKNCLLCIPKENHGTVVLESKPCVPLCPVEILGGNLLLRTDVSQDTNANWCINKETHDWRLRNACLQGNARLTLTPGKRLHVEAGGTLEGGEGGHGTFTVSHAALSEGAMLRLSGEGRLAFGTLGLTGDIRLDCAHAVPGPLLTWEHLEGDIARLRPTTLPSGYTLRRENNALVLHATA